MKLDLEIDLLRAFVAVAETRHFTRAAEQLNRTQSAVSMQIKRLEDVVGCRLLDRTRRKVALTSEGEKLFDYACRMLQLNAEALSNFGSESVAGRVRLGATDTSMVFLPSVLSAFAEHFPLIEFEMTCNRSWDALDSFEARDVDLALVTQPCGREGGILVRTEPLRWAVSARSNAGEQDPVPLAIFGPGCIYREAALRALDACGRSYRQAYNSPHCGGLDVAVSAGLAVTIVPESAVGTGLRVLGEDDGFPELPQIELLLYTRRSGRSPAVEAFADVILDTLGLGSEVAAMPAGAVA